MKPCRIIILAAFALTACSPLAVPATPERVSSATLPPPAITRVVPGATPVSTTTPAPSPSPTLTPTASATPESQPTPDAQTAARQVRLPILMYHYVEPWPTGADAIRQGLTVRPEDFAAQMKHLNENGYSVLSLYDLSKALALGKALPAKAVVLTFDDGYRTLMDDALSIMQPYGYTGTVFVITELMDRNLPQYLTWDQAKALYAAGWRIEPHTKTHAELQGRDRAKQTYEILGALQTIEANLGVMPRFLCYPSGKYDDLSLQIAHEANLWGAVTTQGGRLHTFADRYTWTRVRVDGRGTLQDFINGVSGGLK